MRTSGIVQSPLYMNLVVTARTGISAREKQQPCRDLHIASLSGVSTVSVLDIFRRNVIKSLICLKFSPLCVLDFFVETEKKRENQLSVRAT